MKAIGRYVVVSIEKQQETITKAGIVVLADSQQQTTNSGDKIGTNNIYRIADIGPQAEIDAKVGDTVIINPWEIQLFDNKDKTYGVCPDLAIKAVI